MYYAKNNPYIGNAENKPSTPNSQVISAELSVADKAMTSFSKY